MLLVQNLTLSGRIHGWPTPNSAPPHTFSTFAEGMSPAPSGFSIVTISQEQKAKIGFFTETLAESVNGGMNLLSYRKYEANSCWICFCLIPRQEDTATSVWQQGPFFSSLSRKSVCNHGSCSFVLRQGWCGRYRIFHLEDTTNLWPLLASAYCVQWQGCTYLLGEQAGSTGPYFPVMIQTGASFDSQKPERRQQMGLICLRATH